MEKIKISAHVPLAPEKVWELFSEPEHIVQWNNASADWHTPRALNDLRVGGTFYYRMEARDGSSGFDFSGTYVDVVPPSRLAYVMDGEDHRHVDVTFAAVEANTVVTIEFDPESENSIEMQRSGWQSILNNFARYAESLAA